MGGVMSRKIRECRPAKHDERHPATAANSIDPFNVRDLTFADLDAVMRLEILAIPERQRQLEAELYEPEPL
jgi:hypothetical protein